MHIERQTNSWKISAEKCVAAESLTFDGYETCLFENETIHIEQMLFENKKHEVYTVNKHKTALNRDSNKRRVVVDVIATPARRQST